MRIRNTIWLIVFIGLGCLLSGCGGMETRWHLRKGYRYFDQGKHEEAIAAFKKVIEIDPQNAHAHFILGETYRLKGKAEEALAAFQQAIQIGVDPNVTPEWTNQCQGMIYLTQGKLDDAVTEFQQVIKFNPEDAESYYDLAHVYSRKNEPNKAIEYLQKAFEMNEFLIHLHHTNQHPDFDNIRQTPEYQQLINSY